MDEGSRQARMFADLATSETDAQEQQHRLTNRAELYLAAGLPLDQVLTALRVSRATWYRRVEALRAHEAASAAEWATRKGADEPYTAIAYEEASPDGKEWMFVAHGLPTATEYKDFESFEIDGPGRSAADTWLGKLGWRRTGPWVKNRNFGEPSRWFAAVERTEPEPDDY